MRILYTLHAFNETALGGAEIYTLRLARALGDRHEVTIVFPEEDRKARAVSEEATQVGGVPAIRLRRPAIVDPTEVYRSDALDDWFDDFLARRQPDVVHVQHLLRLSTGWLEVALSRRIPTVLTLHDFWYVCPAITLLREGEELCSDSRGGTACVTCPRRRHEWSQLDVDAGRPARGVLARIRWQGARLLGLGQIRHRQEILSEAVVRQACSHALTENLTLLDLPDVVAAPSQFIIREYARRGVSREIRHVPYGVPFDRPVEKTPSDHLRIGYLGYVARHKGVHVAVEAVRRSPRAPVSLAIHGHEEAGYLRELQRIARGDPRIRFCGPYSPADLPAVHAEIDVLVTPSLWHEVYGIVVDEALALGTPAIVSDRGGMPELVRDGVNGFITRAGDVGALARVLADLAGSRDTLARLRQGVGVPFTTEDNAKVIEGFCEEARAFRSGPI